MFDLEKEIREWKKGVAKYQSFEDGLVADMELHLREAYEGLKTEGVTNEEAFGKAVAQVGTAAAIAREYCKNRELALDRRTPWRPARFMPALLWNYLKMALRNFRRHRGYSFINIAGLALGMTSAILILLWVLDEMSFDRFHANADQICRVILSSKDRKEYSNRTPGPLLPLLKKDFPEIRQGARLVPLQTLAVKYREQAITLQGTFVDPTFFDLFRFPFVSGDAQKALGDSLSVVISAGAAGKLFPHEDAVGKTIQFEWWGEWVDMNVAGVIRDIPRNSHLQYEFFAPTTWVEKFAWKMDNWKDSSYPAYVLLQKHASLAKLQEKIAGTMEKHSPGSDALVQLQPLTRVHLYEFSGGGPIVYIYIFISIGILIMVIAGINFINLTTARSLNRAKEVGLRKVIGSSRRQLVNQFMGESILFASGALVLAITIVLAILPAVNHSLNKNLQLRPTTEQVLVFLAIAFGLGIFSGLYPALFLSRISASDAMRGSFGFGLTRGTLRKLLVIAQFTVSVFFIFASFVAIRQLSFMKNKDLGFKKDHVISLQIRGSFAQNAQAIKSRLLENPNIHSITAFNGSFTGESNGTSISDWEGRHGQAALGVAIQAVDENFTRTFNVPVAQGRFFAANRTTDAKESVVINQAAAMSLGMKDPVGKWLQVQVGQQSGVRKIIGVLKDYHLTTLRRKITPLVMVMAPWWYRQVFIRIAPRDIGTTLTFIQKSIKKIAPDVPWEYAFLDETIDRLYQGEKQMTEIMTFGTLIALTITALGLFGLIVFTVGQRTKEIGVRKVMGASATDILKMLSLDVLKWIIMACVLAWPLAFYAMNKWLGNFAYRVRIGSGAFLFSVFMLVGLALATMSFQAIRAARANPVDSLKYE